MYADILIGINFLFNFFLLWLTSLAARSGKHLARIALGALAGAFFSLALISPGTIPAYIIILFPLLMVFVTFYPFAPIQGIKLTGIFYLISLLSCGVLMAAQFVLGGETFVLGSGAFLISSPSLMLVIISFALVAALVRITWVGLSRLKHMGSWQGQVTVRKGGKEKTMQALVDTGNNLREPVSGSPVIVVYYKELLSLFEGLNFLKEDSGGGKLMQLTNNLSASVGSGIYIIPYRSLGKEGGYLPGFRPEEVVVSVGERSRIWGKGQVVICLSPDRVSVESPSLALVHPELIL